MPVSISDAIDIRYRLQPQDLGGQARSVLVRNVTLEGIEHLTPLVHFEGLARPLALDLEQRMQIAEIAHSHLMVDWIGVPLILRPERQGAFETIQLVAAQQERTRPLALTSAGWVREPQLRRRVTQILLILLLLGVAYAAVTLIDSFSVLDELPSIFNR